jgi:hypothetical protein
MKAGGNQRDSDSPNQVRCNPGAPISRLAIFVTPIGRLAFPGQSHIVLSHRAMSVIEFIEEFGLELALRRAGQRHAAREGVGVLGEDETLLH